MKNLERHWIILAESDNSLLYAYYGDDFTGSTDALESLSLSGVPTALFLSPPSLEEVRRFRFKNNYFGLPKLRCRAVGVAGTSRGLSPDRMRAVLPGIFRDLSNLPVHIFHYKVCSTFDSSPEAGSIGCAIECGLPYFSSRIIPLVVGAPALQRYTVFGNHFVGGPEEIRRLDRDANMRDHPITPMQEADLRLHLARQTTLPIALFDVLSLEGPIKAVERRFAERVSHCAAPNTILLFDILFARHLRAIGRLLWEHEESRPRFVVGSSGVGYAVSSYLRHRKRIERPRFPTSAGKAAPLLVFSGSCSPVTEKQIRWSLRKGFAGVRLDLSRLLEKGERREELRTVEREAVRLLDSGKNCIIHTALGPSDSSIARTKRLLKQSRKDGPDIRFLEKAQGRLLDRILKRSHPRRLVIAGGDTSGYVCNRLGIQTLEMLMPLAPGAPLCVAHAYKPHLDGLEIALKGGQIGSKEYFINVSQGKGCLKAG